MVERLITKYASIFLLTELPEPTGDFARFAEQLLRTGEKEANIELLAYVDIPEWNKGWMVVAKVYKDVSTKEVLIDISKLNYSSHGVGGEENGLLNHLEKRLALLNEKPIDMHAVVDCNKRIINWYGDYGVCPTQFEVDLLFPTLRRLLDDKELVNKDILVTLGSNLHWSETPKRFQKQYTVPVYIPSTTFTHLIPKDL